MTSLQLVGRTEQRIVWEAFPSWAQFTWLYLLSAMSAWRGALFVRFGVSGWELWIVGAALLFGCVAALRRWAHYELTRDHLTLRNGYTGHEIQSMPVRDISDVTVRQGIVADFFGIGTLVIRSRTTDQLLSLKGIPDPQGVKTCIEALAGRSHRIERPSPLGSA